ncbi:hypothetical protein ACI3L3_04185 [Desulfobaculum sp. SPO524]|uniref:hypothetical protein n=1 Tax=Desulfobaculum sp. SPO524 TaxID=3378071 RepID=UPI003854857F
MLNKVKKIDWIKAGGALWRLFLPKFYNRMTWTVVVAGLAIVSTPLLERVVEAVLQKYFELPFVGVIPPWYGLALVGLGLAFNATCKAFEELGRSCPNGPSAADVRDGELFSKFCNLLPPRQVMYFTRDHDFSSSFSRKETHPYATFVDNWQAANYQFQDKTLEEGKKELISLAVKLLHAIAYKTYPLGASDYNRVYPSDANLEEEMAGLKNAEEINQIATDFYERYDRFVRSSQSHLLAKGVSVN